MTFVLYPDSISKVNCNTVIISNSLTRSTAVFLIVCEMKTAGHHSSVVTPTRVELAFAP
jgi:hypothetical protein